MMQLMLGPYLRSDLERPSRIDLVKGALWTHRLRGGPLKLECTEGAVWLTREGDPKDVVLNAGASYGGEGRGLLVIEALEKAQIEVLGNSPLEALRATVRAARARLSVLRKPSS
jgi:hypothetical protein